MYILINVTYVIYRSGSAVFTMRKNGLEIQLSLLGNEAALLVAV